MKKTKVCTLLLFLLITISYTQEDKSVFLVEEVQKKRTIIYIQNNTDMDKSVFLKINPTGYRKSAQRPIIKNIKAKSKQQVMILIPLQDVESSYTHNLIVNDRLETIGIDRNKAPRKEAPLSSILKSELIIFTKKQCKKCETLISKLKQKHVKFREVNIDTKNRYRDYLWELLDSEGYNKNVIGVPLAVINKELIYPIDDLTKFVTSIISYKKDKS